nr:hydantoinase/oxoprolinase family protein [Achromobacter sp. DMS1]
MQAAYAVAEMVDENMSNAARMHAVESGRDLSEFTMIAYGGAAPLHAARLCEKLGMDRLLVPPGAGVGSAIGFLRAPFGYESLRSAVMRLSRFDAEVVNRMIADMNDEVSGFLRETGHRGQTLRELRAYMRYAGQGWEIPVDAPAGLMDDAALEALRRNFVQAYTQLFGHEVEGLDVEVVSWALSLRSEVAAPERMRVRPGHGGRRAEPPAHRPATGIRRARREVPGLRHPRPRQPAGGRAAGGAADRDRERNLHLCQPGLWAVLQQDGCLLVQRNENEGA